MTAAERVIAALESAGSDPKQRAGQWTAKCPAHDDSTPSLSITPGPDGVGVYCHGGCQTPDVVAALGLAMSDLFDADRKATTARPRLVDTTYFVYTDEAAAPLFRMAKARYSDGKKKMWAEAATADGGWRTGAGCMAGVRRVLYHLPEVMAVAAGEVFVVEGEKDAEAAIRDGVAATCAPYGAGSWKDEYGEPLRGTDVVVVADRDIAGYRHARDVVQSLTGVASSVRICLPAIGKDLAEHLGAGLSLEKLEELDLAELAALCSDTPANEREQAERTERHVKLTPASTIRPRPVKWLWDERVALGSLCLLAGREGIGKSTIAYDLAALITRGHLKGVYWGEPKSVVVAATEDSWTQTIIPRLMAAGADLARVFRADVTTFGELDAPIMLPADLGELEKSAGAADVALILLDPLTSRLGQLDTHKDAEVRRALEPLVAMADRIRAAVVGIIHVNKSGGSDAMNQLMGSRAFGAVARSVLFAMTSPDDNETKLLGQPKNNLGRDDLPTMTYTIKGFHVGETSEGPLWTGRVQWGADESTISVADALADAGESGGGMQSAGEAKDWLEDYLTMHDGAKESSIVKAAGKSAGFSVDQLYRAAKKLKIRHEAEPGVFPRRTIWTLPPVVAPSSRGHITTTTTTVNDQGF